MAGVKYSLKYPKIYGRTNIMGFMHILEESVKNIVYASSSAVYGLNNKTLFSENDKIESCNSTCICTKISMEIFSKMYSQLCYISCIGLHS